MAEPATAPSAIGPRVDSTGEFLMGGDRSGESHPVRIPTRIASTLPVVLNM